MVNKVILIGNLGKDPEIRRLEGGSAVAKFSLATNETYKDKAGETQKLTEWHEIVVWRELAELAERFLKKGMMVYIEGKLTHRKYTDANNIDRYITEIVANNFKMLEKREGGGTGYNSNFPTADNAPAYQKKSDLAASEPSGSVATAEAPASSPMPAEGDDLPF